MHQDSLGNTDMNLSTELPFSQACENNKQPILDVLQKELIAAKHVLEIGSGTGQHSVYFAPNLNHLQWQTSDVAANHSIIRAWHTAHPASNLHAPLSFDLASDSIPISSTVNAAYDAVFTANTLHIISWPLVKRLFQLVGETLPVNGKLIIYGPFNDNGRYTSTGNQQFDIALKQRDADSGIRDKQKVVTLAATHGLTLMATYKMPANNQLLIFNKLNKE